MGTENNAPLKQSSRSMALMALMIMIILGAAVWANLWKKDLRVVTVRTHGNRIVTDTEVFTLAGIQKDEKLFNVDLSAVQKRILGNHFVRSAWVNREVPDAISITLEERMPIAALVTDRLLYIDAEGYVLPPVRSEQIFDMPVLTGNLSPGECTPGQRIAAGHIVEALAVLEMAARVSDEVYREISEIHSEENKDLVFYTSEFGVPVIFGHGNTANKLVKFEGFWKDIVSRRGAHDLQYIDLRFDDQVVVRWHQSNQPARHQQLRG